MHADETGIVVRAFVPGAERLHVLNRGGRSVADLLRVDAQAVRRICAAAQAPLHVPAARHVARRLDRGSRRSLPLRARLGEIDTYLIAEGTHLQLDERLGAHAVTVDGITGSAFAVWAPNAGNVSIVGEFNDWDGRRNPMRFRVESGVWEIFLPGVGLGARYKFEIRAKNGALLPLKADPFAFSMEPAPKTASIVAVPGSPVWSDAEWLSRRELINRRDAPISIYEVHLGSWRRGPENRYLSYRELGDQLVPYAVEMGFTPLELFPIADIPSRIVGLPNDRPVRADQPLRRSGRLRPSSTARTRNGPRRDPRLGPGPLSDRCTRFDRFDGTHLYEHSDPRLGVQPDWSLDLQLGRREVRDFLVNNALFWLHRYHVDGLRVDAVASMLYLDFSRKAGEWVPNEFGNNENIAAVAFLRRTNEVAYGEWPGIATYAEESSAWPKVSAPTSDGGLGFGYKWNMGWMHDTLAYMMLGPIQRKNEHRRITFGLWYAWDENFVLPLSHDEVVHLKRSLLGKMPGDAWQRFANLRAYYGFMWTHPGKKLLFMGCEIAQEHEWSHEGGLEWHLLDNPQHAGVKALVRDLNVLYRSRKALHELDCEHAGFEWIDADNAAQSVFSYVRRARDPADHAVVVANFTPVVRSGFRLGVPAAGSYREAFNTDAVRYGGSGVVNEGTFATEPVEAAGRPQSILLTLPPLATIVLEPV